MTDQEQQRADHLALVAATLYTSLCRESNAYQFSRSEIAHEAMELAQELQRAAEERVSKP